MAGRRNFMGERVLATWARWKRAIREISPGARFDGDRDICEALYPGPTLIAIGHWDGIEGTIYGSAGGVE